MFRSLRPRAVLVAAVVVASSVALAAPAAARPSSGAAQRPVTAHSDYLALGDSVSFGYRESTSIPTPDYARPNSFVGFPERVAESLGLRLANASCPGETSASLNNDKARSYDCETGPSGTGPGYRTAYPLHEKYSGSQLAYGVHYLRTHKNTRLVSLMIGANDGFLCQATTKDGCMSSAELGALVKRIEKNVARTLKTIRTKAHYTGQIVIVNYYSTDYADAKSNLEVEILNNALDTGAKTYHVRIADGYTAFRRAAKQSGGDTCAAGLLTKLTTGGCGVHPSVAGQWTLAGVVEKAIKK